MSSTSHSGDDTAEIEMLSVPEVAERLGVRDRDVRGLLSDKSLLGVRRPGAGPAIPAAFLMQGEEGDVVVPGLRGTIIQLADSGFDEAEIVDWLFRTSDELGEAPIAALRGLRTHAVRRSAQALAF